MKPDEPKAQRTPSQQDVMRLWHAPIVRDSADIPFALFAFSHGPSPDHPFWADLISRTTLPFTPNTTAHDSIRGMINTISKVADTINALASDSLAEWRKDGRAQEVWGQKERDGNKEMSQLAKLWPEVNSDDYIAIKKRLGISVESDLALIA
ncbi:hypothetical protein AZE42_10849 [Rhizopogon vesiculosus]|uniref:Uncharacterized protein n=1 Tax=Rhizopogon vesiculosus TaxID=180088 RepID=A0A1J8QG82_9AGAM|nr:hypothetical protein AZE42_10849 [Rhizopogon vesiculosus]